MCINLLYKIKNVAIYLLVAGMVTGCAQEDEGMIHDGDDMSAPSYVSLRFVFPHAASTRANPTGGEAGDGEEAGQGYEQDVSNITLFFYQAGDNDNGVNRNGDIDFATSVYVDDIKSDVIGPIETGALKKGKKYHLLAVANAGDLRNIKSLDSLRTKTIEQVYSLSGTTYGNFVMASAGNESNVLNITDDNSKYNPATTTIEIERLAARVDYKVSDEYSLAEKEKKAVITRAMLVNLYNQPTYILKRVAADVSGTGLLYLGDETTDNYVIDPLTVSKTDNTGIDVSSKWYDRYFPNLTDKVNEDNKTDWEDWLIKGDEITNPDDNTDKWLRIGYAKENTSSIDVQGENYSTGVVFEAEYYNLGEGFTRGATFFRVNKSFLYPTLEIAMKTHDNDFDEKKAFGSFEELNTYRSSLDGNDPAGYDKYLQTAKAGESSYEKYQWSNFKKDVLGYSGTGNVAVPTAKTRQVLHERTGNTTETFLNGRGYYTYWVKHNCGDASATITGLPMENAIVRNNIYKLIVKSISKIGSDIPDDNSPEVSIEVKLDDSWYVVYDMEVE